MISQKNKIKSQKEIKQTLKTNSKIFNSNYSIFLKKTNYSNPKFLISVSKKIFKQAVKRNLLKRKIESIILLSNLNLKNTNINLFIVIKKPDILKLKQDELRKSLLSSFRSLKLNFNMPR
jgi:ribonuclease P protein component